MERKKEKRVLPVEAPLGTAALAMVPSERVTST